MVFFTAIAFLMSLIPALAFNSFYGRSSVCLGLPLTTDRPSGWGYSFAVFVIINLMSFVVMTLSYAILFISVKRTSNKVTAALPEGYM